MSPMIMSSFASIASIFFARTDQMQVKMQQKVDGRKKNEELTKQLVDGRKEKEPLHCNGSARHLQELGRSNGIEWYKISCCS